MITLAIYKGGWRLLNFITMLHDRILSSAPAVDGRGGVVTAAGGGAWQQGLL